MALNAMNRSVQPVQHNPRADPTEAREGNAATEQGPASGPTDAGQVSHKDCHGSAARTQDLVSPVSVIIPAPIAIGASTGTSTEVALAVVSQVPISSPARSVEIRLG